MTQNNLYPCRGCGALIFDLEDLYCPYNFHATCPVCRWTEDLEGINCPGPSLYGLYHAQRNLPLADTSDPTIAFDPEFRLIQSRDFIMAGEESGLTMDVGSDPSTWFYWRNNYWHRQPKIIRKKSHVRKLKRIMHDPERRKSELPEVPPCKHCGGPLEWYVRRSHELAYKCPRCKILYTRGSALFEGPL